MYGQLLIHLRNIHTSHLRQLLNVETDILFLALLNERHYLCHDIGKVVIGIGRAFALKCVGCQHLILQRLATKGIGRETMLHLRLIIEDLHAQAKVLIINIEVQ